MDSAASLQPAVIAFLSEGDAFGSEGRPTRIDTHAASVFLAGNRAWKLKRDVTFPYLDFSSPERRRAALEAELALNRRTAPDLYVAVHPITRAKRGGFAIGGSGQPVDWVLEMRRFPDDALLDQRADRGTLDDALLMRLAGCIAEFHRAAKVADGTSGTARILRVVEGNLQSMAAFPRILDQGVARRLTTRLAGLADRMAPLLDRRAQAGRVRRGHGDLHLANVAVVDEQPVPFDCLEFSEELATVDVLYDLAFLLVDLWQRGLRRGANIVFNRYLDLAPADEEGVALMPVFMSLRASIRALVTAARSERAGTDSKAGQRARDWLALAVRLIEPVPPRLVAIGGMSGTGKSTLARSLGGDLGRAPGARILRTDVIRKRSAGVAPEERLAPESYSAETSAAVYRALAEAAGAVLASGQAAIADAVFARRQERDAIEAVAAAAQADFAGLWLVAPEATRIGRVEGRTLDASDADAIVARRQAALRVGPLGGWKRLSAKGTPEEVAAAAWNRLGMG